MTSKKDEDMKKKDLKNQDVKKDMLNKKPKPIKSVSKIKDNNKALTSTAVLMAESIKAEEDERIAVEHDDINTKLCYERALHDFYKANDISENLAAQHKREEADRLEKLNNMSFFQEIKYKIGTFHHDFHDPVKGKIIRANTLAGIGKILRFVVLFGLAFVILLPFFQKISFAIRSPFDISDPQVIWIPKHWSTLNIQIGYELLTKDGSSFINTLILSATIAFLQVIATAIAGYAFARLKFKGSGFIFALVIASLAIPDSALSLSRSLFFTYNTFFGMHLVGNIFAMYMMTIFGQGIRSAIFIFLFRQTFRGLPLELEESASIDGANVLRTFWSVMLPNARSTIVTVGLFAFIWQYNDYYFATLFNYANKMPLLTTSLAGTTDHMGSVLFTNFPTIQQEFGEVVGNEFYELIADTEALLMMLPLLIGYFFIQKLFVESIERSGITGM
ncbi:MAG: carbohydrate ABC transporter permease [Bacilli bacterium]